MKTEKKLKRGLAELSHLFGPKASPTVMEPVRTASFQIALPALSPIIPISEPHIQEVPELICASFIRLSPLFQTGDFIALLEQTRPVFSETCLLVAGSSEDHVQEFKGLFSLSDKEIQTGELHDVGKKMSFGCLREAEILELAHPHPALTSGPLFRSSKKALIVLDPPLAYRPGQPLDRVDGSVLDVLDHCVFVVETDLNQMTQAYQLIRLCFARNPMARFSIFLAGSKAGENSDLIYDRFSLMISRFLGCDLGFLGWADENEMRLNSELLLEEGSNSVRFSSKAHLGEALFSPISA
jgi:hypothetical protein